MLLVITLLFLGLYALLIFYYYFHWLSLKEPAGEAMGSTGSLPVSVVVAARNEEGCIARLLEALGRQTYPQLLTEVIIVDDFSTDGTAEVVRPYTARGVKLIQPGGAAQQSSKKKAIEAGVRQAAGSLVVVTDADCLPPPQWLQTLAAFQWQNGSAFIAAPVKFHYAPTVLGVFQALDFITLQGITAASVQANVHSMCNGANLAYSRDAFFEVDGFSGIDKVASGDDMLLMYKIWKKHPGAVHYLKSREAIVATEAMPGWRQFIGQRIRWSSKAAYYDDRRVMGVLLFVYLFNCLFFVLLGAALLGAIPAGYLLLYLAGKTLVELPFVFAVAKFYGEQRLLKYFPFFQPLHIFYVVSIGIISQFGKYEWKGRRTK